MVRIAPRWLGWPLRRFLVADHSMEPTLQPGDGLLATRYLPVREGEIRCLPDPTQRGRWLVKRVDQVAATTILVRSDNRSESTTDSETFGAVPVRGTYRVVIRIPRRLM